MTGARPFAISVFLACVLAACSSGHTGQPGSGGAKGTGGAGAVPGATGGAGTGTGAAAGTPSGSSTVAPGMGGQPGPSSAGSGGSGTGGKSGTASGGAGATGAGGKTATSTASGGAGATGAAGSPGSGSGGSPGGQPGSGGSGVGGSGGPAVDGGAGGFVENAGCDVAVSAGATKKNTKLPDPFAMHDGTRIDSKAQWECRRNEIKADLEKYEIGVKQGPPKVEATYSGGKLNVTVTTSAGSITLSSTVSGSGSCVVIGMNGTSSMVTGCTQVPFMHDQVVKYGSDSTQYQSDPYYTVYPDQWKKIGNYSAWSWGISRLVDAIVQVKDQMKVDPTKIAVHGCSYAGKMALFGGAFDERVALTVVEESGGGGINAWRTSQDFAARTGTSIEKIDNTNYSWFLSSMRSLDPYSVPHDHHELIAMVAPRPVIILGNDDYDWLGDESGYKSTMAAIEVFKAMGVADNIGYDFTSGHSHCQPPATQMNSVAAFVNRFLKGQTTADTAVAIKPPKTGFDLDYTKVIDWTTPTLR